MKHKYRICAHRAFKQRGVNYRETYDPVVNWICVKLLLSIESIHEFPSIPIDFVLEFTQADFDADVFMELGNRK